MDEDKILKKLVEQDGKFDRIFKKLVEHDDKFSAVASQKSIDQFKGEVTQTLDDQTVILKRLDQERLFMLERVKRIEADVEKLKVQLHLVPN